MKVKLLIEYFGKPFAGWQEQPGQMTVQSEIQRALSMYFASQAAKLGVSPPDKVSITGSGRTDAGVHARGQVASFFWPEQIPCDPFRLKAAINGIVHHDICVLSSEAVADSFDAQRSAVSKCYSYRMLLNHSRRGMYVDRSWCIGKNLQIAEMIKAARCFVGRHDFTSFRAGDCNALDATRTILASEMCRVSEHELLYTVIGEGFLKQMVRIIVGTIVGVGRGDFQLGDIKKMFQFKSRTVAGRTAPPSGLVLEWVKYE